MTATKQVNHKFMKIGIIGFGNIGGMLAKRFAEFLNPSDIIVFNTSRIKNNKYHLANSAQEAINKSDIIFICVRPQNLKNLFIEMQPKNKIFVTTVAAIYENTYYKHLGKIKLIRIMPSMLNKIGGPILFCPGKYTSNADQIKIKKLLSKIGGVHDVDENKMDAYTHLSSCSAAIVAEFFRLYIDALAKEEKINQKKSLKILIEMLEILTPLLKKDGFKIIQQACTKGGITEQGIKIMNDYQDSFFKELTCSLLKRMSEVRKQYGK